jgi:hypothetical protein
MEPLTSLCAIAWFEITELASSGKAIAVELISSFLFMVAPSGFML